MHHIDGLAAQVFLGSLLELGEGLVPVLRIGSPCYFKTVYSELSLPPRRDIDLQVVLPDCRKELLNRGTLTRWQVLVWLPIDLRGGIAVHGSGAGRRLTARSFVLTRRLQKVHCRSVSVLDPSQANERENFLPPRR